MKRFLLSLVVLVAFTGVTFAKQTLAPEVPPAPEGTEVTVESVNDSVTETVEVALQYAMNTATPVMTDLGPKADVVLYNFRNLTEFLTTEGVDVGELTLLYEEAEKNYRKARDLFTNGSTYLELGDVFVRESKDAEGTAALVLRTKAACCYYEAATYLERASALLETVLTLGEKGAAIAQEMELKLRPAEDTVEDTVEDKIAGRYHLRGRVNRFFSRSRGRRA